MMKLSNTRTARYLCAAYKTGSVRNAVEIAARRLRGALFQDYPDVPVDVLELAQANHIEVSSEPGNDGCSEGMLVYDGERFIIRTRSGVSPQRERFAIAHELGHRLFYTHGMRPTHGIGILSDAELKAEEHICNLFARALLVPAEFLLQHFHLAHSSRPWETITAIEAAARRLRVSVPVVIHRFQDVGVDLPPTLVLILQERKNSKTGLDLRLRVTGVSTAGKARGVISVWTNQTAIGMGLVQAEELYGFWRKIGVGSDNRVIQPGRHTIGTDHVVRRATPPDEHELDIRVEISEKYREHWRRRVVEVPGAICLYARPGGTLDEVYIVSALAGSNLTVQE